MKLLLAILSIALFTTEAKQVRRIAKRLDVDQISAAPWNAFVKKDAQSGCSGSIVGPRQILTAARCTCNQSVQQLRVAISYINITDSGMRWYNVSKAIQSDTSVPRPNCLKTGYDAISILETTSDMVLDNKSQAIEIELSRNSNVGEAKAYGYRGGMLRAFTIDVSLCGIDLRKLCVDKNTTEISVVTTDIGGPLVKCDSGGRTCRQFGVIIDYNGTYPVFSSLYTQGAFIKKELSISDKKGNNNDLLIWGTIDLSTKIGIFLVCFVFPAICAAMIVIFITLKLNSKAID